MLEMLVLKMDRCLDNNEIWELLRYVSPEKSEKIIRYYSNEDASRSLLGDLLIRFFISKKLSVRNEEIAFQLNPYGKPFLIKPTTAIYFNLSHSDNWIVCAIDSNPIGVDVEKIKLIDLDVAKRFFTSEEYKTLYNQPKEFQLTYFYKLWTLKESYIKYIGEGMSIALDSFSVVINHAENITVSRKNTMEPFVFHQSLLDAQSIFALCTLNKKKLKICYVSMKRLLDYYDKRF
ncbi:4'-phosphopantetheinyl transferase family protein [Lysinibacillus fusiformis]|uniref:4'-phosphopantetheinyl transferase family protein n=1 Tax=Lysinibacillus fusiformis TaxID=28031 RepID=UPI003822EB2F